MIILGTNSIKDTGYDVANSLRFNDGSSDNLSGTLSSGSGSDVKGTISLWVKRSHLGTNQAIICGKKGNTERVTIGFSNENRFEIQFQDNSNAYNWRSNALYRDISAWYNCIIKLDTGNGTATSRARVWINNEEITSWNIQETVPQNLKIGFFNNTNTRLIGARGGSSTDKFFDGYIAEVVGINNALSDNTDFIEVDEDSGIIKPIDVSGLTFGTNGFYLDFEDSSSLGNDKAGSNNFTVNNLTAIDQSTDTCTNNFCTLNPLMAGTSSLTYSEGNLKIVFGASGTWYFTTSTIAATQGKWYCEVKIDAVGGQTSVGIIPMETVAVQQNAASDYMGKESNSIGYVENGKLYKTNSVQETTSTYTTNDIIGIAFNLDDNSIQFYKNGSSVGSAIALTSGLTYVVGVSGYNSSTQSVNFGSPPYAISSGNTDGNGYGNFEYAVPSGYYALNTKNLAEYG